MKKLVQIIVLAFGLIPAVTLAAPAQEGGSTQNIQAEVTKTCKSIAKSAVDSGCSDAATTLVEWAIATCAAKNAKSQQCVEDNARSAMESVAKNPTTADSLKTNAQSYASNRNPQKKSTSVLGTITPEEVGAPKLEFKDVANIIRQTFVVIAGFLSVLFLVIGGIRYASSNGNPAQIESAKKTITYSIAGIIVAILATSIIGFVIGRSPQ